MDARSRWALAVRVVLVVGFAWMARSYLAPVMLGALLAVVLHPVQRRLARRIGRRPSGLALTIGVLAIAVVPLALLAVQAAGALGQFLDDEWPATARQIQSYLGDGSGALSSATDSLVKSIAAALTGVATGMVVGMPNQVIWLFLLGAAVFYLLCDGPQVVAWLERASPFSPGETAELRVVVRDTVHGVVIGVVATGLIQGGLTLLALLIFGVPAPFALGVMAAMLSLIPLIGTTPVTIGAVIYLASSGRSEAAVGMAIAAVVIGVSDNLVRPFFMHVATPHQHPLVILLGVFGGVSAFGAAGVFLGPVLAALAAWAVVAATSRGPAVPAVAPAAPDDAPTAGAG